MPKLKTHKSAAKRYKVTASGKIQKRQAELINKIIFILHLLKSLIWGVYEQSECNPYKIIYR